MVEFNQWGFSDTLCVDCVEANSRVGEVLDSLIIRVNLNLKLKICWCLMRSIPLNS